MSTHRERRVSVGAGAARPSTMSSNHSPRPANPRRLRPQASRSRSRRLGEAITQNTTRNESRGVRAAHERRRAEAVITKFRRSSASPGRLAKLRRVFARSTSPPRRKLAPGRRHATTRRPLPRAQNIMRQNCCGEFQSCEKSSSALRAQAAKMASGRSPALTNMRARRNLDTIADAGD